MLGATTATNGAFLGVAALVLLVILVVFVVVFDN